VLDSPRTSSSGFRPTVSDSSPATGSRKNLGVINLAQPKVSEAKIRGSQEDSHAQWVILGQLRGSRGSSLLIQGGAIGSHGTPGTP
jgi:hypothetical protein